MQCFIVTGLSGSGKGNAMRLLEDLGCYVVDNMPPELFPAFAAFAREKGETAYLQKVVLTADVRSGEEFSPLFAALDAFPSPPTIIWLEAKTDCLLRRYKETRRVHPLMREGEPILDTIRREIALTAPLRERADVVVDTTALAAGDLRALLSEVVTGKGVAATMVNVLSFGYKYGLPSEADFCFDVRFLPNPYWVPTLRNCTGKDQEIVDFLQAVPETDLFLRKVEELLRFLLPQFTREGKANICLAIGCTGGRHRSVALAEALASALAQNGVRVSVTHRDCHQEAARYAPHAVDRTN